MASTVEPIIAQNAPMRVFKPGDIYTGLPGSTGRYVPNIDDAILNWTGGFYRVVAVDYTTGLSTTQSVNLATIGGGVVNEDILLGAGPGTISESYRVYINTNVVPYSLCFDARLRMHSSRASYCKLFIGTNDTSDGVVISAVFNNAGVMVSENIPLELVILPNGSNVATWVPRIANVTQTLSNGDLVVAVFYDTVGNVISSAKLLVVNSDFIRTLDATQKFITGIRAVTPYITTPTDLVQLPINMLLSSVGIRGEVTYSDGTVVDYPCDGTKFSILGTGWTPNTLGQVGDFVLSYRMDADEFSYDTAIPLTTRSINVPYRLTAVQAIGAYSVKLFAVPRWNASAARYQLSYYLYNLDRLTVYDVTPYIQVAATGIAFNGSAYGSTQTIQVALQLNQVGGSFSYYQMVQTFYVNLVAPVTTTPQQTYWTVSYSASVFYGANLTASSTADPLNAGQQRFSLANGLNTVTDWLAATYGKLYPIQDPAVTTVAPVPTHVMLAVDTRWAREIPIANILQVISNVNYGVTTGDTLTLSFIKRVAGSPDQQLAIGGLVIAKS
jgi:hypothetical protein